VVRPYIHNIIQNEVKIDFLTAKFDDHVFRDSLYIYIYKLNIVTDFFQSMVNLYTVSLSFKRPK